MEAAADGDASAANETTKNETSSGNRETKREKEAAPEIEVAATLGGATHLS